MSATFTTNLVCLSVYENSYGMSVAWIMEGTVRFRAMVSVVQRAGGSIMIMKLKGKLCRIMGVFVDRK